MLGNKAGVSEEDMVRVFSHVFDTISAITLHPPQCIAFLQDNHVRGLVMAQVKLLQEGNEAGAASMPYYAAILANVCQVELHVGKNALYRQLLKAHVFEQGFEIMSMTSEVCLTCLSGLRGALVSDLIVILMCALPCQIWLRRCKLTS